MPQQPLIVLIVEDNPLDAELVLRELHHAGFEPQWQRVDTEEAYLKHLHGGLDLVLSDYEMPQFNGLQALELLKQSGLEVPFILVSGTIGEDTAVAAMKLGASDYLLKDRLARLGPSVAHALAESRLYRERKQTEKELRLFRTLMDESNDTLEIVDPETGRILDVNGKGPAKLGYTRAEYLSLRVFDLDPTIEKPQWPQLVAHIKKTGSLASEGLHRRKDGTTFPIEVNAKWVRHDRDYIVSVVRDISLRKQAESALRASEERFRQLAENIQEVFWITDPAKNQMLYVSPKYEQIWGRTCASLYADPDAWHKAIHPEDRSRVVQAATTRQTTGSYDEEYRIVLPDGSSRWIRDRAYPVLNTHGILERLVGVAEDITERKNLHEQVLRAQRLEAIGTLAGGLAHDLNNVLSPILISVPLLREHIQNQEALQTLHTIETNVLRGTNIISRVLGFARGTPGKRAPVDLKKLVMEIDGITFETFPKSIRVGTFITDDLWPVLGDTTQLHQALLNLAVNARDAMPNGGQLNITLRNLVLGEHHPAIAAGLKSGPHVTMEVSDTGTGIPRAIRNKIFDPFFTTKDIGKGSGLGLASTLAIVKGHRGHIQVDSEPNQGTVFTIYLPAQPEATLEATHPPGELIPGHGELVLIIDDEEPIRTVAKKMLERFGYRTLLAENGAKGIALYAENKTDVAAVITDMMMPGMDGVATIRALRQINPTVKIIAASGLEISVTHVRVLPKPFSAEALLRTLHELLLPPEPADSAQCLRLSNSL